MEPGQALAAVCEAHRLGAVQHWTLIRASARGTSFAVNGELVVYFGADASAARRLRKKAAVHDLVRRRAVLPVPAVLAVETDPQVTPVPALVQTLLPGQLAAEAWPGIELDIQYALAYDLGRALATLHSVALPSYGDFEPRVGRLGGDTRWDSTVYDRAAEMLVLAGRHHLAGESLLERVERALIAASVPMQPECVLVHGDFGLHHILLNLDAAGWRLSGVVGFTQALAAPGLYDFGAVLGSCEPALELPEEPFLEGYASLRPLDDDVYRAAAVYHLIGALERLTVAHPRSHAEHQQITGRLEQAIRRLEAFEE